MAGASEIRAGAAFYELSARDGLTPVLARAQAAAARFAQYIRSIPAVGGVFGAVTTRLAPIAALATNAGAALRRALGGALGGVQSLASGLGRVGAALGGIGTAGVAAFKPAFDAIRESGKLADAAEAFGLTGEKASRLFGIMGAGGSDLRDATEGLVTFNQRIDEGISGKGDDATQSAQLFKDIGRSASSFTGDSADKFFQLFDALRAIPDPAKRVQALLKAVGEDTGKNLIPLLSMSADQVRELGDAFEQSGEDLQSARQTSRAYALAVAGLGRVWREVATAVAPALATLAKIATQVIRPVVAWVKENKSLVAVALAAAGGLVALGGALVGVGLAITLTALSVGGLATLFGVLKSGVLAVAAVVTSPWTLAAAAVGGLTYAFLRYTDTGRGFVARVKEQAAALVEKLRPAFFKAKEGFGAFANAIQKGDLGQAWEVVATGAEAAWTAALAAMGNAWDDFTRPLRDGLDDVFGGLAEPLEMVWAEIKRTFHLIATAARLVWEGIKQGFGQAVDYLGGLWDGIKDGLLKAIRPILPLLAVLAGPIVLAVAAIQEVWDGLSTNIAVNLIRLGAWVKTIFTTISGTIENAFKGVARELLDTMINLAQKLRGFDPTGIIKAGIEQAEGFKDAIGANVDIDAKVKEIETKKNDDIKKNETTVATAKRAREDADAFAAADRNKRAADALKPFDAAIAKANEPAPAMPPLGGAGLPPPPVVPNVTVRGAFAGDLLAQQLGTSRPQKDADKIVAAIQKNPAEIGAAVALALAQMMKVR